MVRRRSGGPVKASVTIPPAKRATTIHANNINAQYAAPSAKNIAAAASSQYARRPSQIRTKRRSARGFTRNGDRFENLIDDRGSCNAVDFGLRRNDETMR